MLEDITNKPKAAKFANAHNASSSSIMAFVHVSTLQCAFHNTDGQSFGTDHHRGTDVGSQPNTVAHVIDNAHAKHSLLCLNNAFNMLFAVHMLCVKKKHSHR